MLKSTLTRDLVLLLPHARRYGRALIGDSHEADLYLVASANEVLRKSPPFRFFVPSNAILPWVYIELHRLLDEKPLETNHLQASNYVDAQPTLYEQIDSGLNALTEIQKRTFLLTSLEQFQLPITARVLSLTVEQVKRHLIDSHIRLQSTMQRQTKTL